MTIPIALVVAALVFSTSAVVMAGNTPEGGGVVSMIACWLTLIGYLVYAGIFL